MEDYLHSRKLLNIRQLEPLLSNLCVNHLEQKSCEIIQYAVNTVPLTSHHNFDNCKKSLAYSIDVLLDYSTSLAVKLNAENKHLLFLAKSINNNHGKFEKKIEKKAGMKYPG